MKTFVIQEIDGSFFPDAESMDLTSAALKNCVGCWTCWWRTPGKCVFHDLEPFYRSYVNADKVILLLKPQCGFVSSRIKTLFDRMIPLFLPYTYCSKGSTWHRPRYPKYPDIEIYYEDTSLSRAERKLFCDYLYRVFTQFHSKSVHIMPIAMLKETS